VRTMRVYGKNIILYLVTMEYKDTSMLARMNEYCKIAGGYRAVCGRLIPMRDDIYKLVLRLGSRTTPVRASGIPYTVKRSLFLRQRKLCERASRVA